MDNADNSSDPLALDSNDSVPTSNSSSPSVSAVYVTIPQSGTIVSSAKGAQSVIQQPQQSVIQSTQLQTVQLPKGNVIILKQQPNSVIQSPGSNNLHTVQVVETESNDKEPSHKRQILARRPSYRKILNELGAGEISVIPASSLQLAGHSSEGLPAIAMTNASTGGAIVHYAQSSEGQFIVPVATSDLSGLKIATSGSGGLTSGVVLATTGSSPVHNSNDQMAQEAARKREIRLMKNREAAKECRAKKKEYIKCLENRVAVLENQNKSLIDELKTLKALYCQNS